MDCYSLEGTGWDKKGGTAVKGSRRKNTWTRKEQKAIKKTAALNPKTRRMDKMWSCSMYDNVKRQEVTEVECLEMLVAQSFV